MRAFTRSKGTVRRSLAMTAAGALALSTIPAIASAQVPPDARDTDNVCDDVEDGEFDDIAGSAHEDNVLCMAGLGLTQGTNASNGASYAPRLDVTRGQMASFIARFIEDYVDGDMQAGDEGRFDDVEEPYVHAENINKLAAAGIVDGTNASNGDRYEPNDEVTRAQTASLIRRALSFLDDGEVGNDSAPPATLLDYFPDDDGSVHEDNINAVADVGIVQGFDDGDFRPGDFVKRDQMASFVMRGYSYAVEAGLDASQDFAVDMSWFNEVVDTGPEGASGPVFGQGEEGATAEASISVDPITNTVDSEVDLSNVTGDFDGENTPGFHVHDGDVDEAGPVVVGLATGAEIQTAADDADSSFTGVDAPAADGFDVQDIIDDPSGYYLNLHSDDFPAGAVRGQVDDVPVEDLNMFEVNVDTVDTAMDTASFSVDGLEDGQQYRITLVDPDNVSPDTEENSGQKFDVVGDDDGVAIGNPGPPESAITAVNGEGETPTPDHTITATPVDGTITFDTDVADSFHAFVYVDGGNSTFLEVSPDGGFILEYHGASPVVDVDAELEDILALS